MFGREVDQFLEKYKKIHTTILKYIDYESNIEENYQNLISLFEELKIRDNIPELKLVLYLLSKISNYHHRSQNFFDKINNIIKFFLKEIKTLPNFEIFNIFKESKSILLFLIDENIFVIDKNIFEKFKKYEFDSQRYAQFFFPEIKQFLDEKVIQTFSNKMPENFEEKRRIGENDDYICELIRKDLIDEFITYVNKSDLSLNSVINQSIFETNPFLTSVELSLIEYAAFFGSIQIFKYLLANKAKLNDKIMIYASHGDNSELIHILEEKIEQNNERICNKGFCRYCFSDSDNLFGNDKNKEEEDEILDEDENEGENEDENFSDDEEIIDNLISFLTFNNEKELFKNCLIYSIICHHDDIARYLIDKYFKDETNELPNYPTLIFKYYNFPLIQNDIINESSFCDLIKYDYYPLVNIFLQNSNIDINSRRIYISFSYKISKSFL